MLYDHCVQLSWSVDIMLPEAWSLILLDTYSKDPGARWTGAGDVAEGEIEAGTLRDRQEQMIAKPSITRDASMITLETLDVFGVFSISRYLALRFFVAPFSSSRLFVIYYVRRSL